MKTWNLNIMWLSYYLNFDRVIALISSEKWSFGVKKKWSQRLYLQEKNACNIVREKERIFLDCFLNSHISKITVTSYFGLISFEFCSYRIEHNLVQFPLIVGAIYLSFLSKNTSQSFTFWLNLKWQLLRGFIFLFSEILCQTFLIYLNSIEIIEKNKIPS